MSTVTSAAQIRISRTSPAYWRIMFDNPPLNLMGPQFVREFRTIMSAIEADEEVKVVVFESAIDGFFLNHSDFYADFEDLKSIPQGPTASRRGLTSSFASHACRSCRSRRFEGAPLATAAKSRSHAT